MTLVKLNNRPAKTFDSLFNEFFNTVPSAWGVASKVNGFNFPPTNIYETKEAYHLELNVPGRNKEDFKINIDNDLLTVSFEKSNENKTEEFKTIRREFSFENFTRSFSVTEKIEQENIQAKYENGVLKLYLPKQEKPNEAKQINIQ